MNEEDKQTNTIPEETPVTVTVSSDQSTPNQPQVFGPAPSVAVVLDDTKIQGNNFNASSVEERNFNWFDPALVYLAFAFSSIATSFSRNINIFILNIFFDEKAVGHSEKFPVAYFAVGAIIGFILYPVTIFITYFIVKWTINYRTKEHAPIGIVNFILLLVSTGASMYFLILGIASMLPAGREGFIPLGIIAAFLLYSPVFFIINFVSVRYVRSRVYAEESNRASIKNKELILSTLIFCRKVVYASFVFGLVGYVMLNVS